MRLNLSAFAIVTSTLTGLVSAKLGSMCSAPLGPGSSGPGDAFWMENIKHQGSSAYHSNPSYQVFRNVKVGSSLTSHERIDDFSCRILVPKVMV